MGSMLRVTTSVVWLAACEFARPTDVTVSYSDCEEVKRTSPTSGFYMIDYHGRFDGALAPFKVYCRFEGVVAREYLELDTRGDTANYTDFVEDPPGANSITCLCGHIVRYYARVALRINGRGKLEIDGTDPTFATVPDQTQRKCLTDNPSVCPSESVPFPGYASAESCHTSMSGRANIDLRGTPFHVAGTGTELPDFMARGSSTQQTRVWGHGSVASPERKQVDLEATGYCGWYGPSLVGVFDGSRTIDLPLQLEPDR
jgi:hypothetical protein